MTSLLDLSQLDNLNSQNDNDNLHVFRYAQGRSPFSSLFSSIKNHFIEQTRKDIESFMLVSKLPCCRHELFPLPWRDAIVDG